MKKVILVLLFLALAWGAERLVTLDSRVQEDLTQTLTNLAGVPVSIASVDLSLLSGKGEITGLIVANPKGYSNKNAFEMGLVSLDLDVFSALTQPLVISSLVIEKPTVNLEVRDDLQSNLQEIIGTSTKQMKVAGEKKQEKEKPEPEASDPDASDPDADESAESDSTEKEEKREHFRIAVRKLEIRDTRLIASRGLDSWEDTIDLVDMENVGGDKGYSITELGIVVTRELTGHVLAQSAKRSLTDMVEDAVKDLGNSILESLNNN